jgi:hypothetical protein
MIKPSCHLNYEEHFVPFSCDRSGEGLCTGTVDDCRVLPLMGPNVHCIWYSDVIATYLMTSETYPIVCKCKPRPSRFSVLDVCLG